MLDFHFPDCPPLLCEVKTAFLWEKVVVQLNLWRPTVGLKPFRQGELVAALMLDRNYKHYE